jgi:hypothetical protein
MPAQATPAATTNLFRLEELEDVDVRGALAQNDVDALRTVGSWIEAFIGKPNNELLRCLRRTLPSRTRRSQPFFLIRQTVLADWKFFLDDDASLDRWAQRFGASGAEALASELRRLPWRAQRE